MLDYFQLLSAGLIFLVALVPLNIASRLYRKNIAFFSVSALLGIALVTHGVYRVWESVGDNLYASGLELLSALLVLSMASLYTYIRWK